MSFKEEIIFLENYESNYDYISKMRNMPILFTAAHAINQNFDDGI